MGVEFVTLLVFDSLTACAKQTSKSIKSLIQTKILEIYFKTILQFDISALGISAAAKARASSHVLNVFPSVDQLNNKIARIIEKFIVLFENDLK